MSTVNPFSDYEWRRSSYCASGACVQVAVVGGTVMVRESKSGSDALAYTASEWGYVLAILARDRHGASLTLGRISWSPERVTWERRGYKLTFTSAEWDAFIAAIPGGKFAYDKLSSPAPSGGYDAGREVGPAGNGPDHAATGAGAIAVPPVPVAAQPRYILDKDAILELVQRYGEACKSVVKTYFGDVTDHRAAKANAADLLEAIRGALTPVPDVEPEPRWGAGPLVKHVTETPAAPKPPEPSYPAGICRCGADGHGPGDNLCVCLSAS